MLTSTLRDAAAPAPTCGLTPGAIPLPPSTMFEVKPLFKVDIARWTKARNAGPAGDELSFQVNYDYKALFPRIGLTENQLLYALTTTIVDHRTLDSSSQLRAVTQADRRSAAASLETGLPKNAPWREGNSPQSTEKLTAWADKLANRASYPMLETILSAYDYSPGSARTLAKLLISKQVLLRAMLYRSYQFAPLTYLTINGNLICNGTENWTTRDQSAVRLKCSDFVVTYKGLTNPYTGKGSNGQPTRGIYKPFVDGTAWLWANIPTPFEEDRDHMWTLSAKYEGGSIFRIYLTRATVRRDLLDTALGALKGAVSWLCDKLTRDDLQLVVNAAGAVPEPNTQAVVTAWKGAAMACGMAFPTAPAPLSTCPELATTPSIQPTFWDLYQKPILLGGAGVVALLLVKQLMGRGKVRP